MEIKIPIKEYYALTRFDSEEDKQTQHNTNPEQEVLVSDTQVYDTKIPFLTAG